MLIICCIKEYEAARKQFVEIKGLKDEIKRRLDEVRRQNAPMQKRLDEVTNKAKELEDSTRELVSEHYFFLTWKNLVKKLAHNTQSLYTS